MLNVIKIQQLLDEKGISATDFMQEILGKKAKQSLTYLRNRPGITFSKVEKIANLLGVSIDSIRIDEEGVLDEAMTCDAMPGKSEIESLRASIKIYKKALADQKKMVDEIKAAYGECKAENAKSLALLQEQYDKLLDKVQKD